MEDKISRSRFLLQNPYAYLDGHGSYSAILSEQHFANEEEIRISRILSKNQYAHLDGDGNFTALTNVQKGTDLTAQSAGQEFLITNRDKTKQKYRSNTSIEKIVRNLQQKLWSHRGEIWGNSIPSDPIEILDPAVGLKFLGFDCEIVETLGFYRHQNNQIEVAGLIDNAAKVVKLSRQLPRNTYNFTLAHELGHAVMHTTRAGLHRDRPMDGSSVSRDKSEIEADKFATYFLMPEKLLKARFKSRFLSDYFSLNDDTSFALMRRSLTDARKTCRSLRELSRFVAVADQYNGVRFVSLAEEFQVSKETLAIRLEELGLVAIG